MTENYKATFTSDEATFQADIIDFNIQDGTYKNLTEKDMDTIGKHKSPFWVTFEFVNPNDPCLEYLVNASKNTDTFRPQKVEIQVTINDKVGKIIMLDGIIPKPIKQPSAMIELKFESLKFESA